MQTVENIRNQLVNLYNSGEFVRDEGGQTHINCVELIGAQFIANEDIIFGKINQDYINREISWYESQSLNVNDIPGDIPKIWQRVATDEGFINSNYGWCIWSPDNYNQYDNVLQELSSNQTSRRGQMIYTRPDMWIDFNYNGKSDFICTTAAQYFIRHNKLVAYVTMRSNDAWAGYRNDLAWHKYVQHKLYDDLRKTYPTLEKGDIIWNAGSLHIYERQFYLLEHYSKTGEITTNK